MVHVSRCPGVINGTLGEHKPLPKKSVRPKKATSGESAAVSSRFFFLLLALLNKSVPERSQSKQLVSGLHARQAGGGGGGGGGDWELSVRTNGFSAWLYYKNWIP